MPLRYIGLIAIAAIFALFPAATLAAPPEGGEEYIVQADDWLSKLAEKFYGNKLAYSLIVEATNLKAATEAGYAHIDNPDLIEVGQRLFIPAPKMAEAAMVAPPEEEVMTQAMPVIQPDPSPEQLQLLASLSNRGTPPELLNEVWLNSEPLKLADLHGKVVLVEFWTFGCFNCKNVIPALREWHHNYADDGLVIIGVHTPEFSYEEDVENVRQALVTLDVPYPVAIDSDWTTWRSYKGPFNQRYWPTQYFIDKSGNVRHIHIGEGRYAEQEEIIQALLAEKI